MSTIPESALVSEDWQLAEEDGTKPASLLIQLRRRAHVLHWFRFVSAEGDNAQIQVDFASHLLTITGNGLAVLLVAIAAQRVVRLILPTENEANFGVRGPGTAKYHGPGISDSTVENLSRKNRVMDSISGKSWPKNGWIRWRSKGIRKGIKWGSQRDQKATFSGAAKLLSRRFRDGVLDSFNSAIVDGLWCYIPLNNNEIHLWGV